MLPELQEHRLLLAIAIEIEAFVIFGLLENNEQQVLDTPTIRVAERASLLKDLKHTH